MLSHNQILGQVSIIYKDKVYNFKKAIVWICTLNEDVLIAEYGDNLPSLTIPKEEADSVINISLTT